MFRAEPPYRILVADDHEMVVDGYRSVIDSDSQYEIVGEAKNGREVQTFFESQKCDIIILDINMPKMNGIQTIEYLNDRVPSVKILVVSMLTSPLLVKKVLDLGVAGYIFKTSGARRMLAALEEIVRGNTFFEDVIEHARKSRFVSSFIVNGNQVDISPRELEIIKQVSLGKSAAEIADELNISTYTVQTHRRNINIKLNTHNTAELISFAIKNAIISFV